MRWWGFKSHFIGHFLRRIRDIDIFELIDYVRQCQRTILEMRKMFLEHKFFLFHAIGQNLVVLNGQKLNKLFNHHIQLPTITSVNISTLIWAGGLV